MSFGKTTIFILQLHAISQRLKQPCTSFELTDGKYDFSHVLDFTSRLKNLKIDGSDDNVRTSNICPNKLSFDLIPFKSLCELYVSNFPMQLILNTGNNNFTIQTSFII